MMYMYSLKAWGVLYQIAVLVQTPSIVRLVAETMGGAYAYT